MDHFPKTATHFLNSDQNADTYPLLMELYWEPLQIYYRGSSFSPSLGEPEEVVNGFLAWYAERQHLKGWRAGEQRLRYYLINGFKKFLLQEARRQRRDGRMAPLPEQVLDQEPSSHEFDRSYVRGLLQQALSAAEERCRARGLEQHWRLFFRHTFDGVKFRDLAAEFSVSQSRAEVMSKAGRRRFREAFWELLGKQGLTPAQFPKEVDVYLEILES